MQSFSHAHYVVSLRTKQGEFDAVERLTSDVKEHLTPLWEIQPTDATEEGDDPAASADSIVNPLPKKIHDASAGLEGFIDSRLLHPARRRSTGEHPLAWICEETAKLGTRLTPVVSLDSDVDCIAAANHVEAALGSDIAVRLGIDELGDLAGIRALVALLSTSFRSSHLIVDCEHIVPSAARLLPMVLPPLVNAILALGPWKTVTILTGSIPADFAGYAGTLHLVPRLEWPLWLSIVPPGTLSHRPAFGDYGISHPEYRFVPWYARGSAKIRYTGHDDYHIFIARGLRAARHGGYSQFHALAAQVVAHAVYRGAPYSTGDTYIDDCANTRVGTGNLTTWVMVGTNQHITYLARLVPTIP
jgi:hypothetical protein